MTLLRTVIITISCLLSLGGARGQETDPHRIYEYRCATCHEADAGDFVSGNLLEGAAGTLIGILSGREVEAFLTDGHGGLAASERASLMKLFGNIADSDRPFLSNCRICHDRAVDLAREKLVLQDGKLYGRYSGRDIEMFLQVHGRLNPGQVPVVIDMLKRQLTDR